MAYKQKGMDFGNKFLEEQNESEVTSMDYLRRKPSIVASESAKKDYDADDEDANNEETKRINTTPYTRPPMFSDADAHRKVKKN